MHYRHVSATDGADDEFWRQHVHLDRTGPVDLTAIPAGRPFQKLALPDQVCGDSPSRHLNEDAVRQVVQVCGVRSFRTIRNYAIGVKLVVDLDRGADL
jgi:hypothetical protein